MVHPRVGGEHLCMVTPDAILDMDAADYAKLQGVMKGFTGASEA